MNFKLTLTQCSMLFVATQREDRCLEPSAAMNRCTAGTVRSRLIEAGYGCELKERDD